MSWDQGYAGQLSTSGEAIGRLTSRGGKQQYEGGQMMVEMKLQCSLYFVCATVDIQQAVRCALLKISRTDLDLKPPLLIRGAWVWCSVQKIIFFLCFLAKACLAAQGS